jgi:ABC-2 type transport system permease protein
MRSLIKAELLKLKTTRTPLGLLAGAVGISILAVVAPGENALQEFGRPLHEQQWMFFVGFLTRIFLLVLGIRAITDEFRYGTITPTLLTVPQRTRLVGAKLIAVAGAGLAIAVALMAAMTATAAVVAALNDVPAPEFWNSWPTYAGLAAVGLIWPIVGLGIGLIVRAQVAAIFGGILWLMAIEDVVRSRLGDIGDYLPGNAGLGAALAPTTRVLLVSALTLMAYGGAAVVGGALRLRRQDLTG